jgi:hypothetical protein
MVAYSNKPTLYNLPAHAGVELCNFPVFFFFIKSWVKSFACRILEDMVQRTHRLLILCLQCFQQQPDNCGNSCEHFVEVFVASLFFSACVPANLVPFEHLRITRPRMASTAALSEDAIAHAEGLAAVDVDAAISSYKNILAAGKRCMKN